MEVRKNIKEWNERKLATYALMVEVGDNKSALKLRNQIVENNLNLVWREISKRRVRNPHLAGVEDDDMLNTGSMGMMKAVERYDAKKGAIFSTYATFWIRAYVARLIECGSVVKKGRTRNDLNGYMPIGQIVSTDELVGKGDSQGIPRLELLNLPECAPTQEDELSAKEDEWRLQDAIRILLDERKQSSQKHSEKFERIIHLRMEKGMLPIDIAKEVGVSRQRINQIEKYRGLGYFNELQDLLRKTA